MLSVRCVGIGRLGSKMSLAMKTSIQTRKYDTVWVVLIHNSPPLTQAKKGLGAT